MKRFFNKFSKEDSRQSSPSTRNQFLFSGGISGNNALARQNSTERVSILILAAAQSLSDTIQEILSDTSRLTGENISGFSKLLQILEAEDYPKDTESLSSSDGLGCLQLLLNYKEHSVFIETCNQVGLATALMHALRLLRMFEIKQTKLPDYDSSSDSISVTSNASLKVCQILECLCGNTETIEQIRQSLVKLLTFPIGTLPTNGVHIQGHSLRVLTSMCRTGFTSQQVWYLHDAQAMTHMVRQLTELTTIVQSSPSKQSSDHMLRGLSAEKAGMWLIGTQCVVEVIAATLPVSTVLLSDFEVAGGPQIFLHILRFSAPERFMSVINIITKVLFDPPKKQGNGAPYPIIGNILQDFLFELLQISRGVMWEDSVEKMIEVSQQIFTNAHLIVGKDYVFQGIAYVLLTFYSNDPHHCVTLEASYHFLSLLAVSLPVISQMDALSAVLTTLNYVCQCVESRAMLPLMALTASCTVMMHQALHHPESRSLALLQLELSFCSFDSILLSDKKFAMLVMRAGFLKHVLSEPFERLSEALVKSEDDIDPASLPVYEKLVAMIVAINAKSPYIADELRQCGLSLLIRNLIGLKNVSSDFAQSLLRVPEELALADTSNLEETLYSLFNTLQLVQKDFGKLMRITDSIAKTLLVSGVASFLCARLDALDHTLAALEWLDGAFLVEKGDYLEEYECLISVMRLISVELALTNPFHSHADRTIGHSDLRNSFNRLARNLKQTGIFSTGLAEQGVELVIRVASAFEKNNPIINPASLETLVLLLPHFSESLVVAALEKLKVLCSAHGENRKVIAEARVPSQLIKTFYPHIIRNPQSKISVAVLDVLKDILHKYMTVDGFQAIVTYLLRPLMLHGETEFRLMQPWEVSDEKHCKKEWMTWQIIEFLMTDDVSLSNGVPVVCMGEAVDDDHDQMTLRSLSKDSLRDMNRSGGTGKSLSVLFTDSSGTFPPNQFTYSCWVKFSSFQAPKSAQEAEQVAGTVIPILSLNLLSPRFCFLEAYVDLVNNTVRVSGASSPSIVPGEVINSLVFKPQLPWKTSEWNLFVLSVRKPKRFTALNKVNVSLSVNGLAAVPVNTDTINMDFPGYNHSVDLQVGKMYLTEQKTGESSSYTPSQGCKVLQDWQLGPIALFEEALSQEQVALVFSRGPHYSGSFTSEAPTNDFLPALASQMLLRCNSYEHKSAEVVLEMMGWTGLESAVEPAVETLPSWSSSEAEPYKKNLIIPSVAMAINAAHSEKSHHSFHLSASGYSATSDPNYEHEPPAVRLNRNRSIVAHPRPTKYTLMNSMPNAESHLPAASTEPGVQIESTVSMGEALAALGGPDLLLPVLQAASTVEQICCSVRMIGSSLRSHCGNMKFMQQVGYKIMAFLLSSKPLILLEPHVIDALMKLAVDERLSKDSLGNSRQSMLLFDTAALYHLLLNHQIWNAHRFPLVCYIISKLSVLVMDERYSSLNSKRFAAIGGARWLVMITLHSLKTAPTPGIKPSSSQRGVSGSEFSIDPATWQSLSRGAAEMAEYRDEANGFFLDITTAIYKVITAELRQKDLELLSKTILFTFVLEPEISESPSASSEDVSQVLEGRKPSGSSLEAQTDAPSMSERNDSSDSSHLYPFCNYSKQESNRAVDPTDRARRTQKTYLTPLDVFRIQLFRTIFTVYDSQLEDLRQSVSKRSTSGEINRRPTVGNLSLSEDIFVSFRSAFNSSWFLGVLERANDIATKSHCLRLLALLLQKDAVFMKDFCTSGGFKVLHSVLTFEPQEIPVMLPLIAMLFRLSVQVMMHPFQIKSVAKFIQVLDLDECLGPDLNEGTIEEFTTPLLSILFDCLTNAFHSTDRSAKLQDQMMELLLGIFNYGLGRMATFKHLMQRKAAIEILVQATLNCSNAFNDYGTRVFSTVTDTTTGTVDLTASLQEDYIHLSGNCSDRPQDYFTLVSAMTEGEETHHKVEPELAERYSIEVLGIEGPKLLKIVSTVLQQALVDFSDSSTLFNFFISYPPVLQPGFEFGYQKLLLETFHVIVDQLTAREFNPVIILSIADSLAHLIPLVRLNIIYDSVLFELLTFTLDLLNRAMALPSQSNLVDNRDKMNRLIKELGYTARYFAHSYLIQSHSGHVRSREADRYHLFSLLNRSLPLLFNPLLEDSLDSWNSSNSRLMGMSRLSTEERSTVLEAIQGLGNMNKKGNVNSLEASKTDRQRVSRAFWVSLVSGCFTLVLEENAPLRIEATRIIAFLAINRTQLMEQLLGNPTNNNRLWKLSSSSATSNSVSEASSTVEDSAKGLKEVDVFKDGFLKLVPNSKGKYEIFLKGGTDNNDSEENRFADFSFWVSDNNEKCDRLFQAVEQSLQAVFLSGYELDESLKQIRLSSFNLDLGNSASEGNTSLNGSSAVGTVRGLQQQQYVYSYTSSAEGVQQSMYRAEVGQKLAEQIAVLLRRWTVSGFMHLAYGAHKWRIVWNQQQSSPIWGYMPLPELLKQSADVSILSTNPSTSKEKKADGSAFWKGWHLDLAEGPERMRKKLGQDYSIPSEALFKEDNFEPEHSMLSNSGGQSHGENEGSPSNSVAGNHSPVGPTKREGSFSLGNDAMTALVSDGSEKAAGDMESFLKQIAGKGLIKRMDSTNDDFFEDGAVSAEEIASMLSMEAGLASEVDFPVLTNPDGSRQDTENSNALESKSNRPSLNESLNGSTEEYVIPSLPFPRRDENGDIIDNSGAGKKASEVEGRENSSTATSPLETREFLDSAEKKALAEQKAKSQVLHEIVKGLLGPAEWMEGKVFNINRISGLEIHKAMLVLTPNNIHILNGFTYLNSKQIHTTEHVLEWVRTGAAQEGAARSENMEVSYADQVKPEWVREIWEELLSSNNNSYLRIPLSEVYSFFRRRHQLKYCAMEITDVRGASVLYACQTVQENEQVLVQLLQSELSSSIFSKVVGLKNMQMLRSVSNVYNRLVSIFVSSLTTIWQQGQLSNFEYLMHLNAAAGRSFQDLTQYPVFPWVLADYSSEELDFEDPATFRDLSKPMGALGDRRAQQYRERYQTMDEFYKEGIDGSSPPFFYGTHYSCAGYVLHYLIRLQPYANMSVVLQGGSFDKADRLFLSIENSWLSASRENLQDVRELIPEFYFLPEFLTNHNKFGLGYTQREEQVQDVVLPRWANNDPREFVRIHREALECRYVSENLHSWIDLVFGFRQRGKEAIKAMNVFIHLTYEGEVDIDAIEDVVMRNATIAQINNFGQTPSKIFNKPHSKRIIPEVLKPVNDVITIDPAAVVWHSYLSPPLCTVGAPVKHYTQLNKLSYGLATFPGNVKGLSVGDMGIQTRDKCVVCPEGAVLVSPTFRKYVRVGDTAGSISVQMAQQSTARLMEGERSTESVTYEGLHTQRVTCIAVSKHEEFIATGSADTSVRLWRTKKMTTQQANQTSNSSPSSSQRSQLHHVATFTGHSGAIQCLDVSTAYSCVVSGCLDGLMCMWDYRMKRMIRLINVSQPLLSVSISHISGQVVALTTKRLFVFGLNGDLMGYADVSKPSGFQTKPSDPADSTLRYPDGIEMSKMAPPTVAIAVSSAEWQNGIVAVTGHKGGQILLWKLDKIDCSLVQTSESSKMSSRDASSSRPYSTTVCTSIVRPLNVVSVLPKTHKADITSLRLCPSGGLSKNKDMVMKTYEDSRLLDLLVGDTEGFVSRWASAKLDQLAQAELLSLLQLDSMEKSV